MTDVVICGGTVFEGRFRGQCPTCERETDFLHSFGGIWYDDLRTCIECGDAWSDGYRCERPFRPRWRQERTAKARAAWETALSPEAYSERVKQELDAEMAYWDGTSGPVEKEPAPGVIHTESPCENEHERPVDE